MNRMTQMIAVGTIALVSRSYAEVAPREIFEAAMSACATASGVTWPEHRTREERTEAFRERARPSAEERAKMKTVFDCAKAKVEAQGYEASELRHGHGGGRPPEDRERGLEMRPPPPPIESNGDAGSAGDM